MHVHWDVALIWVGWGLLALPVFAYYIRQVDAMINKATLVQNASSWAHKAWLLAAGWNPIECIQKEHDVASNFWISDN